MVLQGRYSDIIDVLKWCYSGVPVVLQWCYRAIPRVDPGCSRLSYQQYNNSVTAVTTVSQQCDNRVATGWRQGNKNVTTV
jgi:hypothetical protein